jgi:hypothetical protein
VEEDLETVGLEETFDDGGLDSKEEEEELEEEGHEEGEQWNEDGSVLDGEGVG